MTLTPSLQSRGVGIPCQSQKLLKLGDDPEMTDARLESVVPGLNTSMVFVCSSPFQIEKFLRVKKAIVSWVGTSKEHKNSMQDCLTHEGTEPKSKKEPEAKPGKEGGALH